MAEGISPELQYGWFSFRPRVLQFLNGPKWFLFFICQYFFTQSVVVNGIFPASISTIERRYGYSSSQMGLMASMYDIAAVLFSPFVGYVGGSRRKPVWCGCGLFAMGIGFVIFLLPHLIIGNYHTDAPTIVENPAFCSALNHTNGSGLGACTGSATTHYGYYVVFLLGMFVIGAGATPMLILAIPYLDENVRRQNVPMYVGIFAASGILGLVLGTTLATVFLAMYVDIGVETKLTPKNHRWVGAWWLGFAVFAAAAAFWTIWSLGFPKEFPGTKYLRLTAENDPDKDLVGLPSVGFFKLSDMCKATGQVFTSLPLVFITLAGCTESFLLVGIGHFMPKILNLQFQFPVNQAGMMFGVVAGVSAIGGNLIGAYINKRLNLTCTGAAKMCFIISVFGFLVTIPLFIHCESAPIAGVSGHYHNSSEGFKLGAMCNSACHCEDSLQYNPLCGNGVTYYSVCHAGCKTQSNDSETFLECSCVAGNTTWLPGKAKKGACTLDCGVKPMLFLGMIFLLAVAIFLNETPAAIVTLRCVPYDQRSYALALQWDLIRLLGTIPGPIVFGSLIDRACILWDTKCGKQGSCLAYSNSELALAVLFICFTCKLLTMLFFGLTWLFSNRQFRKTGRNAVTDVKVGSIEGKTGENEKCKGVENPAMDSTHF